jgi:hypothetical protein
MVDLGTEGEKNVSGREEKIPSRSPSRISGLIEVAGELLIMTDFE